MRQVEAEGKTLEEAVAKALRELGLSREQVKVEVLSQRKGFLGILGTRIVRVRVTPLVGERALERAKGVLSDILERMHIRGEVNVTRRDQRILLEIWSPEGGLLIGRGGRTLEALQYLVNRILNSQPGRGEKVVVDVEGYRKRREERLKVLAARMAERVKTMGEAITLAPLSPHDRRIVHLALQGDQGVKTVSEGAGFYRRIVISPSEPHAPQNP